MSDAPLIVEFVPGKESVRLVEPWDEVPKGFVSDGASVPRWLWALLGHPLDRHHRRAGVAHDWGYEIAKKPRNQLDAEYRENLSVDGLGIFCRWLEYFFVRLCGGKYYGLKNAEKQKKENNDGNQ